MAPRFAVRLLALLAFFTVLPSVAVADESAEPPPVVIEEASPIVEGATDPGLGDEEPEFDPLDPEQAYRDIVFPVVGPTSFSATYGACRDGCTRSHMGADISTSGWKGGAVVAAHDGTVVSTRYGGELSGCSVAIEAEDGWTTRYIHLNDDVPGTDLAAAPCVAPGIEVGRWIPAGTLLGWIGDTGNAEDTTPHLHFEIRNPDGLAVEPFFSLVEARRVEFSWISSLDVLDLSREGFGPASPTVYVVDTNDLTDLALAGVATTYMDGPIIPIDSENPIPALAALEFHSPERVIILSHEARPAAATTLAPYATIVAVGALPSLTPPDAAALELAPDGDPAFAPPQESPQVVDSPPDAEDFEADVSFRATVVPDQVVVVVAGRSGALSTTVRKQIEELGHEHRVVLWETDARLTGTFGSNNGTQPDSHADRSALWWNTSEGWVPSDELNNAPATGLALVSAADANPWTLAYLASLGVAPRLPLWHHEPPVIGTRSL